MTKQVTTITIAYINLILQTVEAEITSIKTTQRTRDAESRARNCLANGPLRAQSNGYSKVFCDAVGKRKNAGDMLVSC